MSTIWLFQTIADAKANTEYNSLIASVSTKSFLHCVSGPYYKYYYVPGYLYWPPIIYRSCDGLVCGHPGVCAATSSRVVYRWAIVFRCTRYYCYFVGICYIRFVEHLRCQCRERCTIADCQRPKMCNKYMYKCECPTTGICRHGYMWDPVQCRCIRCIRCVRRRCPSGYYFDYSGVCGCMRFKRPEIP